MKCTLLFAVIFGIGSQAAGATLINGAGASFPYPLYAKWFAQYEKVRSDVRINYQSIGSGGGVRQFIQKTVDFGATDAPMTDEQLATAPGPIVHVPTVLGAVVVTYHLPGLSVPLKLSGEVLAEVFLGTVKKWNDPKIAELNAGVTLPNQAILVVHRSDGSGTTQIFTDFLSKLSPAWGKKVGAGMAVRWPTGLGGKGNEGVAGLVKQTPGSVGYVELIFAKSNGLEVAQIRNQAGKFVAPTLESVTAAAEGVAVPDDFRVSVTHPSSPGGYPIAGFTYWVIWEKGPKAEKASKIKDFLIWALTEGQKTAPDLHYAPLPKPWVEQVLKRLKTL